MACMFEVKGQCRHIAAGGPTDADRCASCPHYSGSPRGLGDLVHSVARVTGAATVVRAVNGGNCAKCEERRRRLNEIAPNPLKGP